MRQVLKQTFMTIALSSLLFGMTACTTGSNIDNEGDSRRVGKVVWDKQLEVDVDALLAEEVPADNARLVLIRKKDNNSEQMSANISINDRYQVSLQSGNYTVVNSCVGQTQLSAHATGFKNNDLLAEKETYQLIGGETYFFYVDMNEDGQGRSALQQVTADSALSQLASQRYQSHQISRVTPNCESLVVVAPTPQPAPVVVQPAPAILAEKLTIDLEVLFDTDKAVVQPQYYTKIADVAAFMTQYANTITTIEGHTDSRGSDGYNQALSQRRVDAVKELLITRFGIAAERVNAIGYGEAQPRASNDDDAGRQLNRRVVAVVEERSANK